MAGRAAARLLGELVALHRVWRDGEVASELIVVIDADVGARSLSGDSAGVITKPIVELRFPAVESVEIVVVDERLEPESHRWTIRRCWRACFAAAARCGVGWGGSSSAASNASKYWAGTTVVVCAAITLSARTTAA